MGHCAGIDRLLSHPLSVVAFLPLVDFFEIALMKRASLAIFFIAGTLLFGASAAEAAGKKKRRAGRAAAVAAVPVAAAAAGTAQDGAAEAKLIEVYRLIGQGRNREALSLAQGLVQSRPHFQLAQLVYGDLLTSQTRPLRTLGDVPDTTARAAANALAELREESQLRLKALRERPPAGTIPAQFLALSVKNKHAIAVDASRSRLYLFENTTAGLKLVADYYLSVGKAGTEKHAEGDLRTPLGVYFITNNLERKSLKEFYGAGALPINYPNPHDQRSGRSGSGIWLHGTPPSQFARAPRATDGCLVLANPDLIHIIKTVEIRSTPVVIAPQLQWVQPADTQAPRKAFEQSLLAWQKAKSSGNLPATLAHYAADFDSYGKKLTDWTAIVQADMARAQGKGIELKDLSMLQWTDNAQTMVVTFGEVAGNAKTGPVKRQYWTRVGAQWKIFFEGVIG